MDNFFEGLCIGIGVLVGTLGLIVVVVLLGALVYYLSLCVSTNIKLRKSINETKEELKNYEEKAKSHEKKGDSYEETILR